MTFTIPNLLSLLRMGIVPIFIIAVLNGDAKKALILFVAAGISDALDGALARLLHQQSLLGTYLDPVADKLLMISAYVALSIPALNRGPQIPLWVTVLVLARDILLVVVALVLYLAAGVRNFPVTILSKVTTVCQVLAVMLVLISAPDIAPAVSPVAEMSLYLVAILTLASGLFYVYRVNRLERPAEQA
jgi:cardiolipin synthase